MADLKSLGKLAEEGLIKLKNNAKYKQPKKPQELVAEYMNEATNYLINNSLTVLNEFGADQKKHVLGIRDEVDNIASIVDAKIEEFKKNTNSAMKRVNDQAKKAVSESTLRHVEVYSDMVDQKVQKLKQYTDKLSDDLAAIGEDKIADLGEIRNEISINVADGIIQINKLKKEAKDVVLDAKKSVHEAGLALVEVRDLFSKNDQYREELKTRVLADLFQMVANNFLKMLGMAVKNLFIKRK